MGTEKLLIWGFYEGAITMIFDILESLNYCGEICIVNKSLLNPQRPINNNKMNYIVVSELPKDFEGNYLICENTIMENKKYIDENIPRDKMISIVHKFSSSSSTTSIGCCSVINAGVVIAGHSSIGDFTFINRNVSIGHHTKIGNRTTINPGCNIGGNVDIREKCLIGIGATIIQQIIIGRNTIIGAGSVVVRTIEDNVIAFGNPCKINRKR
jgi:UDP-N-acetylbacillosamine N-acetyltransferase